MQRIHLLCALLAAATGSAFAADIRVQCYSDGNECEVLGDLAKRFEARNAGIKVTIDKVPYKAVVETLPVQLAAGEGPDIARVTDLGGLNKFYLDLTPALGARAKYWEDNFGPSLKWLRGGAGDKGIYGMMSQLTVTGAFVNKSLFEQAKVPMPGPTATWDDWMEAARKVAAATKTPYAMAMDRSGHRFAPLAVAMGAKIFDANGNPVIDDGYKAAATKFVDWNKAGYMPKEVWGGVGGSQYRDAFEEFANGRVVMYYSGSWQVKRMDTQVTKKFDWMVVPAPCGPGGCTAMPGGAAFVALKRTKAPADVAKFLDFLASEDVYKEYMAKHREHPGACRCRQGRRDLRRFAGREGRAQLVRRRRAEDRRRQLRAAGLSPEPCGVPADGAAAGTGRRRRNEHGRRAEAARAGHGRTGEGRGK